VNLLETERLLEGDSPRFGRSDEAEVADEEDVVLVDRVVLDALQLGGKQP
jgi:hypothetical protein